MAEHGGILIARGSRAVPRRRARRRCAAAFAGTSSSRRRRRSSSGTALIEVLQMLDRQPPAGRARARRATPTSAHLLIEAFRHAHRVARRRSGAVAGSERRRTSIRRTPPSSSAQIDPGTGLVAAVRRPTRTAPRRRAAAAPPPRPATATGIRPRLGRGTSALVVADRDGNVVVVTQTLSTWGGSFYVSQGPRLPLQQPPADGAGAARRAGRADAAGAIVVGQRARRSSAARSTAGWCRGWRSARRATPGSSPSVVEVIHGVVDGGLGAQAAVEAPRLRASTRAADGADRGSLPAPPGRRAGPARPRPVRGSARKGELRYGFVLGGGLRPGAGALAAGADPRRSHAAVAVP